MFFRVSKLFRPFDCEHRDGKTFIRHAQFTAVFDHSSNELDCSDQDVLNDFGMIIRRTYGTYQTKEEVFDSIQWDKFPGASVIYAGVCHYPDRPWSGWDGTLNAVWADDASPAPIVNVYYSWVLNDHAHGFMSLSDAEIAEHRDKNAILRSMILRKATHPEESGELDRRIKGVIRASLQ